MVDEQAFILVGQWAVGLLIAYACITHGVAAYLSWLMFRRVSGGVIAWMLGAGFSISSVSWLVFAAAVQVSHIDMSLRYLLIMLGLVLKAISMTLICVGIFKWLDIVMFIRRGWTGTVQDVTNLFKKDF